MFAIVAVAENGAIGDAGKMAWNLPLDFKWFKYKTLGGVMLMGRKTYLAIGRPLPGRITCVITTQKNWPDLPDGVRVCQDWKAELPQLKAEFGTKPISVCGGAQIYSQLLPECDYLYLTRVKKTVEGDTVFPPIPSSFSLVQNIFEHPDFRVEKWANLGAEPGEREEWPF